MADSNKPIVPGGDTVGTVGEVYLSKNGKTYECVAVIDNTTVTPSGETIPRVEYVWVCTDDGAGGGAFPFDVSDAEPITISRTKEELISAIDAGKTPIGYWRHTQSNGTVIRLFHFVKRFDVANGTNLTFYFSDKTSNGVLDIKADGTIKRTYQNNDSGGASGSANFTFTITPTNGPGSQMLSATRTEMLAALDAGKTLLGYWTETRTILETTDTIKHEFRLESVSGTGADRGLAFVNYEQFYKSTLYVNGNDTVSFVDKEVLPTPTTKTEAMTQSVGMDDDGRLWTEPGTSGGGGGSTDAVLYTAQTLTDAQKKQARENVDAAIADFVVNGTFNSDMTVTLDKTFAQIQAAIQEGKQPVVKFSHSGITFSLPLVSSNDTNIAFCEVPHVGNNSITFVYLMLTSTGDVSIVVKNTVTVDNYGCMEQVEMKFNPISDMQIATKKYVDDKEYILHSRTPGSTKKFKITVDDSGTLTATEVTETT